MSRLSDKLKREREEREARKAERERKRKEKEKEREKEKLRRKRERHHKVVRSRQNRRYYKKVRAKQLKERAKNGDVYGYYMILLMKNRKRMGKIGIARWKTEAYRKFNESVSENREHVKFPVKIYESGNSGKTWKSDYEIIIVQKVEPNSDNSTYIRNNNGKFVEHVITDNDKYIILDKAEWYVEEKFNVYGYHPIKDRKSFDFIMDNIILKDIERDTARRIFTFKNKLVVQYDTDFDFITCKTPKEAERLYDAIQKETDGNPYLLFTGQLAKDMHRWFVDEMVEKTGWDRSACTRCRTN
jgi:hypothetical protein